MCLRPVGFFVEQASRFLDSQDDVFIGGWKNNIYFPKIRLLNKIIIKTPIVM
jgi:hypothetical protein